MNQDIESSTIEISWNFFDDLDDREYIITIDDREYKLPEFLFDRIKSAGFVISMWLQYPSANRYGAPDELGRKEGSEYLADEGFNLAPSCAFGGEDTHDDTPMRVNLEISLPHSLVHTIFSEVVSNSEGM